MCDRVTYVSNKPNLILSPYLSLSKQHLTLSVSLKIFMEWSMVRHFEPDIQRYDQINFITSLTNQRLKGLEKDVSKLIEISELFWMSIG